MTGSDWIAVLKGDPSPDTKLVYADWIEENGNQPLAQAWREYVDLGKSPYPDLKKSWKSKYREWFWFQDRKIQQWGDLAPFEIEVWTGKQDYYRTISLDNMAPPPPPQWKLATVSKQLICLIYENIHGTWVGHGQGPLVQGHRSRVDAETALVLALLKQKTP